MLEHNLHELEPIDGLRAVLISLVFATVVFLILRLVFKGWQSAALITTLFMVMFFAYGPVRTVLPDIKLAGWPIAAHRYMYPVWGILIAILVWWAGWKDKHPERLTPYLNLLGLVLVGIVIIQAAIYLFQFGQGLSAKYQEKMKELGISTITDELTPPPSDELRDIYYIILDGYSRDDILLNEYGYDNSAFTEALESRGFYVADCSSSNYDYTVFSLGSSLNLDYIPPIGEQYLTDHDWRVFADYFRYNVVRDTLIELGYKTVAFDTGGRWTLVENSDYFFSLQKKTPIKDALIGGVTEFEDMLMDSTLLARRNYVIKWITGSEPVRDIYHQGEEVVQGVPIALYPQNYDRIKYNLESLQIVPTLPGSKFVYAHLTSTHRPFYFDKDGSFNPGMSTQNYINSTIYTNNVILNAIDTIIADTYPAPIIIVQGDHSRTGSKDAFGILNAYYLPDGGNALPYPTISPINSFRIVFNYFFDANFPLLDDVSYDWYHDENNIYFSKVPHDAPCYE